MFCITYMMKCGNSSFSLDTSRSQLLQKIYLEQNKENNSNSDFCLPFQICKLSSSPPIPSFPTILHNTGQTFACFSKIVHHLQAPQKKKGQDGKGSECFALCFIWVGDGNWLVGEVVSFPSEQAFLIFLFLVGCIVGVCCLYMGYLLLFSSLLYSFSKKTVVFGCGLQKNAEYATHILILAHFNFFI